MLPLISVIVATVILVGNTVWLWYMTSHPRSWARFTEAENNFWVRRGLPVQWAGACKKFERGIGLKVLVAAGAVGAAVLFVTALTFLLTSLHHRT